MKIEYPKSRKPQKLALQYVAELDKKIISQTKLHISSIIESFGFIISNNWNPFLISNS